MSMLLVERQSIRSDALRMDYFRVPWDSEIFGRAVAQIEKLELGDGDAAAAFDTFERWSREANVELTTCRLDHLQLREAGWLGSRGFRFVETMLYPRVDALDRSLTNALESSIDIVVANQTDLPALESVAATAFVTSRFVIDPGIAPGLAATRYRVWVRNSFGDAKHQVLKANLDGAMVGFFIVEERDANSAYWHLTAVNPAFHGRGIGRALWLRMMRWHSERGIQSIETAVSGHNLPVIGLYGSLGWRFVRSDITLHRGHLGDIDGNQRQSAPSAV